MADAVRVYGSGGGGKSGGGGGGAKEEPNTLRSNTTVRALNLISYGPCYGLVNASKSIFMNDTQLQANDGSYNFSGVMWEQRTGEADQAHISGFTSSANSFSVNTEVKYNEPIIRTLQGPIDACRVTVALPSLAYQDPQNGNLLKAFVAFNLYKRKYGTVPWIGEHYVTYYDKCVSEYNESFRVNLGGSDDWEIKYERGIADSEETNLQNKTFWATTTILTDAKFAYPNCGMVGLTLDAKQFGTSVPTVAFHWKGVIVKVPSNYDPVARTYTGLWDGNFVTAWTNNPAWLCYSILTDVGYGLGEVISEDSVDKFSLYQIAQYCDEMVPDGYGGTEPRYTFNYQFNTSMDAFAFLQILAASFRGMVYYAAGTIRFRCDMPADPVRVYTDANVIGGFQYEGSGLSARHSRVAVTWFDPTDMCRPAVEIVDDPESIERYGVNETAITAYGCTSRGLAHRFALWILDTEKTATEILSMEVSWDGAALEPGDIIGVADKNYAGIENAALVVSSTTTSLTLDRPVTITGSSDKAWINCADGTLELRDLTNSPGTSTIVTFVEPLTSLPVEGARVGFSSDAANIRQFRITSGKELSPERFLIVGTLHDPDKYGRIENGLALDPKSYSAYSKDKPSTPTSLAFSEYFFKYESLIRSGVTLTLRPAEGGPAAGSYEFQIRRANSDWVSSGQSISTTHSFSDVDAGTYEMRCRAISLIGVIGDWLTITSELFGQSRYPSDVTNLSLNVLGQSSNLSWSQNTDVDFSYYTIRQSPLTSGAEWSSANLVVERVTGTSIQVPTIEGTYLVKAVNLAGNQSANAALAVNDIYGTYGLNAVSAVSDYPTWDGASEGVTKVGTTNKLDAGRTSGIYYFSMSGASGSVTSSALDVLSTSDILALSNIYGNVGTLDLGAAYRCYVSALVDAYGEAVGIYWRDLGLWKDLGLWSPVSPSDWSVWIEVQTTKDDPTSPSAVWTEWQRLTVGYYEARGFRIRMILNSFTAFVLPVVEDATLTIDMEDRIYSDKSLVSSTGGTSVSFSPPFKEISGVGITAQNMATGDYFLYLSAPDVNGFTIQFKNSSGVSISRTFDYIAAGYGTEI